MSLSTVHGSKDGITDIDSGKGKEELRQAFIMLRAKGFSYSAIAQELHVSKGTLTTWSRQLEAEIASAKAMELEALQEEYMMLKEGRIRTLGELTARLRKEALSRDLSEVSTEKLLDMLLKYGQELQAEAVDVRPLSAEETARLKDKTGTNMNSQQIEAEMAKALLKYRAGQIDGTQARQELSLLSTMLKAREQVEIEERLDKLEAVITGRK